jgi:hypothetical protein
MLKIESKKGFNILVTTRSWPKGKDFRPKKETIKEIFGDLILGDLDTSLLPLDKKLLHIFLTNNVIPREDYRSIVLLNDVVLMEKLISGSLVDLSRIMLAHMQYCFNHESHALPYPHLVKKILKFFDYYPEDIPETSYTSCLTLDIIRSLKFRTDEQPSQPPLLEAPPIAPSFSSAPPPPVGIDPAIITDGFKGLETTIFESAQYLGNIITKFGMHHAETVANIEAMVKTLYTCHSSFLEAFEEMMTVSSEFPEVLAKRVLARKQLKEAKRKRKMEQGSGSTVPKDETAPVTNPVSTAQESVEKEEESKGVQVQEPDQKDKEE